MQSKTAEYSGKALLPIWPFMPHLIIYLISIDTSISQISCPGEKGKSPWVCRQTFLSRTLFMKVKEVKIAKVIESNAKFVGAAM